MLGSLISAGASLAGGFLGRSAQKSANSTNAAIAAENAALQREFAQNGIQWKVADAQKAGIHPLYALGASTHSFSPVSVGAIPESGLAAGLADAGQNIGRAIDATRSNKDKAAARISELSVERGELENQLLREQIRNMRSQTGPGLPDLLSAAASGQEGKSYGWHMSDKRGIAQGFLEPPSVDEEGNRLITLNDGHVMKLPANATPAELSEELLGEFGSFADQAAKAGMSGWDYLQRLVENWTWENNPLLTIRKIPERR